MNEFTAVFMTLYKGYHMTQGVVGFYSQYSAEQIQNDNNILNFILESLNNRISSNVKLPLDQTIVFIPELLN